MKDIEIIDELNLRIHSSNPWTSADTVYYLKEADKFLKVMPATAYMIKGIVYTHDKDEKNMRKNFEYALQICENEIIVLNYITSLQKFEYLAEAINLGLKYEKIFKSEEITKRIAKLYLQLGLLRKAKLYLSQFISEDNINNIFLKNEPYIHSEAFKKMQESFKKNRQIWLNLANS